MSPLEQYIEVTRGLNQFGANRSKKYQQEEIFLVLNKMQDRFIRSCLRSKDNGGFEIDQLKVDDIQPLIVSGSFLVPYIDGTTRYKCYLPSNYKYLLSDSSYTKDLTCGNIAPVVADKPLYLNALRQERSAKGSPSYYTTNVVTLGGTTVSIPTDLPYGNSLTGFNSKDDLIFLVPYIASKAGWYWERAGEYYYPGHYIRLSSTPSVGTDKVTVDGTDYATTVANTLNLQVHSNAGTLTDNRLTNSNLVGRFNSDPFYKSSHFSPISELSGNILQVYRDNNFTVSGVIISYIRKPQTISLSLNTSCELPEGPAQIICDWTVEHIKGKLENTTGQQLAERDIDRRVTL